MRNALKLMTFALALMLAPAAALAANCTAHPFTLTNGSLADANQVMSDFNNLLNCANNNLAHNGANSDITSLSALSTPLSVAQGGTGTTASTGSGSVVLGTGPSLSAIAALGLRDTSAAFDVTLGFTSSVNLTAGRALTIDVANAARTLKINGNATVNQDVSTTATPTFAAVRAGTFSQTNIAAATFYTAIPVGNIPNSGMILVHCGDNFNVQGGVAEIDSNKQGGLGNIRITRSDNGGGGNWTFQIDGSGNFQVKNANATSNIDCEWVVVS